MYRTQRDICSSPPISSASTLKALALLTFLMNTINDSSDWHFSMHAAEGYKEFPSPSAYTMSRIKTKVGPRSLPRLGVGAAGRLLLFHLGPPAPRRARVGVHASAGAGHWRKLSEQEKTSFLSVGRMRKDRRNGLLLGDGHPNMWNKWGSWEGRPSQFCGVGHNASSRRVNHMRTCTYGKRRDS